MLNENGMLPLRVLYTPPPKKGSLPKTYPDPIGKKILRQIFSKKSKFSITPLLSSPINAQIIVCICNRKYVEYCCAILRLGTQNVVE